MPTTDRIRSPLLQEVLNYYLSVRPGPNRFQWVLSTETVNKIKQDTEANRIVWEGIPPGTPVWPEGIPISLCGRPIRIDESVPGLSHEML